MRRSGLMLGGVMAVLFWVSFAQAQFGKGAVPKFYGDFKPVVGGWAEYEMKPKGEASSRMKIAIVGKDANGVWYETVVDQKKEGKMISKMLVSGDPGDPKAVKRIIVKMGTQPAMEMPVQMTPPQAGKPQGVKGKVVDKGSETIKVPAGTFTAQHVQYQDGDMVIDTWVHKDVSPYGLVKSVSKDQEMILVGYGTGAKTLITEEPQKFKMPQMPGMPGGAQGVPPTQGKSIQQDNDDDEDEDGAVDEDQEEEDDDE